jgi:hypothetical protein
VLSLPYQGGEGLPSMNTQLLRFVMLSEHPTFPLIPRTTSGFERTGRTCSLNPTDLAGFTQPARGEQGDYHQTGTLQSRSAG